MKKRWKCLLLFTLSIMLILPSFSGCGKVTEIGGANIQGINTDRSFSVLSSWTTSGVLNQYNSNTAIACADWFLVEGLYSYIKTTNMIYAQLADGMPATKTAALADYKDIIGQEQYDYLSAAHKIGTESYPAATEVTISCVKIKDDAKWQNGEDFVAKDVWSYYMVMYPEVTGFLIGMKVVDDKTIEFIWHPNKTPSSEEIRNALLAQDKSGTIKYDLFKQFIDPLYEIFWAAPVNETTSITAFNRKTSAGEQEQVGKLRTLLTEYNPSWYVATGPFVLDTFSMTQLILKKNPYHWAAEKIGFDTIKVYSSGDLNQTYNLLTNGYIDYLDGYLYEETKQSILAANENLVYLKTMDAGAMGVTFPQNSKYFSSFKVREAFQYLFDREEIAASANPIAPVSWTAGTGESPSDTRAHMSQESYAALKRYSYDPEKAKQMLEAEGWSVKDGSWYDASGEKVKFTMGTSNDWQLAQSTAEATKAQLEAFGFEVDLILAANFWTQAFDETNDAYDIIVGFTEINGMFQSPIGYYRQFETLYSKMSKLPRYDDTVEDAAHRAGRLAVEFPALDDPRSDELYPGVENFVMMDYIDTFYYIDEARRQYLTDLFNTGIAEMCLSVQFFQNVTASMINAGKVSGVPMEDLWAEDRNVPVLPRTQEEILDVSATVLGWAGNYAFTYGMYSANTPD